MNALSETIQHLETEKEIKGKYYVLNWTRWSKWLHNEQETATPEQIRIISTKIYFRKSYPKFPTYLIFMVDKCTYDLSVVYADSRDTPAVTPTTTSGRAGRWMVKMESRLHQQNMF